IPRQRAGTGDPTGATRDAPRGAGEVLLIGAHSSPSPSANLVGRRGSVFRRQLNGQTSSASSRTIAPLRAPTVLTCSRSPLRANSRRLFAFTGYSPLPSW